MVRGAQLFGHPIALLMTLLLGATTFQALFWLDCRTFGKIIAMIEVTIRTDNEAALQKLLEFISTVGFQVVGQKRTDNGKASGKPTSETKAKIPEPPIQWAEEPDVMALAGIWEGKEITLEELRKQAWGDRL
jgi:hypothetical protein